MEAHLQVLCEGEDLRYHCVSSTYVVCTVRSVDIYQLKMMHDGLSFTQNDSLGN